MNEVLLMKLRDIKTVCMDRLDSITANGEVLREVFQSTEEALLAAIAMDQKKKK